VAATVSHFPAVNGLLRARGGPARLAWVLEAPPGVEGRNLSDADVLVQRVCAEFIEMPGLNLTFSQAMRLWGLDATLCRQVIDHLVRSRFLRWTLHQTVIRADVP
jgi:hypothetical protein